MKPFLSSSVQSTALREENPSDFPSSLTPFLSWDTISPPWTITSQSSLPLKFKRDLKLYQHPPDERVGGRTTSASRAVLPCPSSAQVSPPCFPLCWVQGQNKLNVVTWPWQGMRSEERAPSPGEEPGYSPGGPVSELHPWPVTPGPASSAPPAQRHFSDQILWQSKEQKEIFSSPRYNT